MTRAMSGRPDPLAPECRALLAQLVREPARGRPVAFDADGTLWRGDVGEDLLRYLAAEDRLPRHAGRRGLYAEYERLVEVDPADAYAFAVEVMEGLEEQTLQALCRDFFRRRFVGRVFPFVRPLLAELDAAGFSVWIVSASPRWIVQAGAEALGLRPEQVIGVDAELDGGRLTSRVRHPVPCGEGKVTHLERRGLRPVLGVGNGDLDLPMLAYSERALVVAPFGEPGNALVRAALDRGWPVQRA